MLYAHMGLCHVTREGKVSGQRVADARYVLDRHGASLTTAPLPGDGWRTQHDALKWRIFGDAKEMGARCRVEVYGLFATCMPQDGRALAAGMPPRKGQGLVPVFLFTLPLDAPERKILFEFKTPHYGSTTCPGDCVRFDLASASATSAGRADPIPRLTPSGRAPRVPDQANHPARHTPTFSFGRSCCTRSNARGAAR